MIRFSHEANSWQVYRPATQTFDNVSANVARVMASVGYTIWWSWDQTDNFDLSSSYSIEE